MSPKPAPTMHCHVDTPGQRVHPDWRRPPLRRRRVRGMAITEPDATTSGCRARTPAPDYCVARKLSASPRPPHQKFDDRSLVPLTDSLYPVSHDWKALLPQRLANLIRGHAATSRMLKFESGTLMAWSTGSTAFPRRPKWSNMTEEPPSRGALEWGFSARGTLSRGHRGCAARGRQAGLARTHRIYEMLVLARGLIEGTGHSALQIAEPDRRSLCAPTADYEKAIRRCTPRREGKP